MPATAPLRHPKECRRRKCNNGEIPHATLRNSICIFEEKVLAKNSCQSDMDCYEQLCKAGISHDSAGYVTPQGLRNVLIISATPFEWKHIIGQRSCRRNTDEMRIVVLNIWEDLYNLSPTLFLPEQTGPFCQRGKCLEGKMCCGIPIPRSATPTDIILKDYPGLTGGENA